LAITWPFLNISLSNTIYSLITNTALNHVVFFQLRLTKVNEQLECEKREFVALLEKRTREIDSLNGTVNALNSV
jgi:hypothetical protein